MNSSDQQRDESSVRPHYRIELPSVAAYSYVPLLFILVGAIVIKMYKRSSSSSAEDARSDSRVEHGDSGACNNFGYMSMTDDRVMEASPENP